MSNASLKRNVLSSDLNLSKDSMDLSFGGSWFHKTGAALEKAWSPYPFRFVLGTVREREVEDLRE